eukprot:1158475-Pelagomonas_calceolata.AAC.4
MAEGQPAILVPKNRRNHVGSRDTPYIDLGKGDTLAQKAHAVLDIQFMKLSGWSCTAPNLCLASHTTEYPMRGGSTLSIRVSRAKSDQDSIRAAGGASSLIRNARFEEGDLQPECSADRPVTGPRQST